MGNIRYFTDETLARRDAYVRSALLRDVLDALRDDDAYALWALARAPVDRFQSTELGASRREILACYLAERFAAKTN